MQGVVFGVAAIIGMVAPLPFADGIQFDARSVAISVCGLYFGPLAAVVAGGMAGVFRVLAQGGAGAFTGVLVILASGSIGVIGHYRWRPYRDGVTPLQLWGMGVVVHAAMLLLMFTLPNGAAWIVLPAVGVPVIVFFPLTTMLLGVVISDQRALRRFLHELHESNERFRATLYSIGDGVITTDEKGIVREMNPVAEALTGWQEGEARSHSLHDVFSMVDAVSRDPVTSPYQRVLREGGGAQTLSNIMLVARDGKEVPIEECVAPIHDESGEVGGVVLVIRDRSREQADAQAIRDAQQRFERALQNIPDLVFIYDPNLRIQYVNEAARQRLDRPRAAYIGRRADELWPEEVCSQFVPTLHRALDQRALTTCKVELELSGGSQCILAMTYVPIVDGDGAVREILGIGHDLTEQQRADDALMESERRFRSVFDQQFQFMALVSPDGILLEINSLPLKVGGVVREDVLGMRLWDAPWWTAIPKMRENWPARLEAAAQATGPVLSLDTYQTASGEIRFAEAAITAVRDEQGAVDYFIVQASDVTEKRQAREELLTAKQLLENIFASLSEAVLLIDTASGEIVQCNPAVEQVFGYSPGEFVGLNVQVLHTGKDHATGIAALGARAVERGETVRAECPLRRRNDARIVAEVAVTMLPRDEQEISRVVCVVRDITAEVEAVTALRTSEALLRIAGSVAQVGGWIVDLPEGRVTWSEEVRAIHELPAGYVPTFEEGLEYFPEEWRGVVADAFEACKRDGTPFDIELELITAHERRIWIRAIGQAVRNSVGEITRIQGAFQDITKIKEIEDTLAQSQVRFRQFTDALPLIVWTANPDGSVDYVSRALEFYSGKPGYDSPGERWVEVLHPDDVEQALSVWGSTVKSGEDYTNDFRVLHRDGEYRWNHAQATPVRDEDGTITKWYGSLTDIHDTKLNEAAMARMAGRLKATLESITDAFYTLDRDWRFTYLNPEAERLLQRPKQELLGKVGGKEFRETMGSEIEENFFRAMRENQSVDFNTYYAPLKRWFEVRAYPSEEGLAVYFQDITQRVQAEQQLQEVTRRLQNVLDFSPLLITEIDRDGVFLLANNAVCAVLGNPAGGMVGKPVHDLLPEEDADRFLHRIAEVIATGESKVVEDVLDVEGIERTFSTVLFPLTDETQTVVSVGGIAEDITERKNAEAERETLELQLRQAQKMEAVGRLAGGVAHDFNNMLGVILGYTDMVLLGLDDDDPIRSDLDQVKQAATRSANLTRQLLAFARKQTIAPKVLDLNTTVSSILKMLGRLIGEEITLIWQPGENLWPVHVDPTQLDQILANLAVNARDAIDGHGELLIETTNAEFDDDYCEHNPGYAPGQFVLLTVQDNGAGMDDATIAKIFEPFFTTKDHGHGTGLGLATVYGIVKQNGGFVVVDSAPGQGSTFKVYLPRYVAHEMPKSVARDPHGAASGTETVLLVEDEVALLRLGARQLEKLGYTVLAASLPSDALELAAAYTGRIDILVTDVIMPEMNGRELSQRLLELRPDMRVLFMSGYTADVIAQEGALDEGVHFLQKPFKIESMAAKVRSVLGDHRTA